MVYYGTYYDNSLQHHGVVGMKWGVRRYQNYDGSLTQAGLKKYKEAEARYDKKKQVYDEVKKDNTVSRETKRLLKANKKQAKKELSRRYDDLKILRRADEGKILYRNGKRITTNRMTANILTAIGSFSLSAAKTLYDNNAANAATINALAVIGGLSITAGIAKTVKNARDNRNLNAYYYHPTVRK